MLKRGLGVQAADVLRNDILSGSFQPGEQITEEGLAKQFGISRSTVRTSIQQLVHEGIVRYEPYKGNYIRPLTAHDVWEIYTLRNALEALASRLAAQTITDEGRTQLESAMDILQKAIEKEEQSDIIEADFALHTIIFELSQHKQLLAQYNQLAALTRLYMNTLSGYRTNLAELLDEHTAMVLAITQGNADKAELLAKEHNTADGLFLQQQLRAVDKF